MTAYRTWRNSAKYQNNGWPDNCKQYQLMIELHTLSLSYEICMVKSMQLYVRVGLQDGFICNDLPTIHMFLKTYESITSCFIAMTIHETLMSAVTVFETLSCFQLSFQ
jgi:hypothetical protein